MNLFPASPAGGVPSYLDEVRSTDKRLRMYHRPIGDTTRPSGLYPVLAIVDQGSSIGYDTGEPYFDQNSASTYTGAIIYAATGGEHSTKSDMFTVQKFKVLDNTNIRYFWGWTSEYVYDINDNDTIASDDSVGFQFSTNRGDTNWQLITNNAGTQTTTDSGVAFSTGQIYIMEIEFLGEGTSVRFRISDENFNVLMNDTVVTSNIPTDGSEMNLVRGIMPLSGDVSWRFYWSQVWY